MKMKQKLLIHSKSFFLPFTFLSVCWFFSQTITPAEAHTSGGSRKEGSTTFQTSRTRIMPLGNSITQARAGRNSYRRPLWHRLQGAGYPVNFVGSQNSNHGGAPANADFDQDHEGHWGWTADQLLGGISGWAQAHRPDVVLMHVGSNDMFKEQDVNSTISELGQIIDRLRAVNPNVKILLAKLIQPAEWYGRRYRVNQLNQAIPTLASQKNTAQSPVILVDQTQGFDAGADTYDGVHPNESGERKMADRWFEALTRVLSRPAPANPPPVQNLPPPAPAPPSANKAPHVILTSPANNSTHPASVSLQVNAWDDDGSVSRVEYFSGNEKIGEVNGAPFSFSWQNIRAGRHTVSARVTDNRGGITHSGSATITVSGGSPAPTPAPPANPAPVSGSFSGYYQITARHSGKALDVADASYSNGARIIQYSPHSDANQQWSFESAGSGFYRIKARHSGKVLGVNGTDNLTTEQSDYRGSDSQQWRVEAVGDGFYRISNKMNGHTLDVAGAYAHDGATVLIWASHGNHNQQWRLQRVHSSGRVAAEGERAGEIPQSVSLYPNPAAGKTNLRYQSDHEQRVTIVLVNMQGRAVCETSQQAVKGDNEAPVNLTGLARGMYSLKLLKDNKVYTRKLVITR